MRNLDAYTTYSSPAKTTLPNNEFQLPRGTSARSWNSSPRRTRTSADLFNPTSVSGHIPVQVSDPVNYSRSLAQPSQRQHSRCRSRRLPARSCTGIFLPATPKIAPDPGTPHMTPSTLVHLFTLPLIPTKRDLHKAKMYPPAISRQIH